LGDVGAASVSAATGDVVDQKGVGTTSVTAGVRATATSNGAAVLASTATPSEPVASGMSLGNLVCHYERLSNNL